MKIPVNIAEKLWLLSQGESIPSGSARHSLIEELISEGIIERNGRIKKTLRLQNTLALNNFLKNKYSINDLKNYIEISTKEEVSRNELVIASSDSKLRKVRTFKGFLVNSFIPIAAILNNEPFNINPTPGTFHFIYDFENLIPEKEVTIVGIENPENFRYIEKQQYLFQNMKPLFVSRYPQNQSKDLMKWLLSVPNNYLHFGDFDFAGIGIYLNEFKKFLGNKSEFFIPENIDDLIKRFGNKKCYDVQKINFNMKDIDEKKLLELIEIIHRNKKGLEQEMLCK